MRNLQIVWLATLQGAKYSKYALLACFQLSGKFYILSGEKGRFDPQKSTQGGRKEGRKETEEMEEKVFQSIVLPSTIVEHL